MIQNKNDDWAKEKVKDVVFECLLNIKLKTAGICPKLLVEMTSQDDFEEYVNLMNKYYK